MQAYNSTTNNTHTNRGEMACTRIAVILCLLFAQTVWSIRICPSKLEVGDLVVVEATCRSGGVEVTWNGLNDEVDLVQIEYTCMNATAEDNDAKKKVLVQNTFVTSGSRMVSTEYTPMDCTISGCYEDWLFDRYAIAPTHLTCPPFIQNTTHSVSGSSTVPRTSTLVLQTILPIASSPTLSTVVAMPAITSATLKTPKSGIMISSSAVGEISSVKFLETPLTSPYDVTPGNHGVCNCELTTVSRSGDDSGMLLITAVLVVLVVSVCSIIITTAALLLMYKKHKMYSMPFEVQSCKSTEEIL